MNIAKYGSKCIAIIGAGVAGLHLGLRLQQMGIACTIVTDRTPEEVAASRLANTVVHWATTLQRERVLNVDHWPAETFGFNRMRQIVQTPRQIDIRGRIAPSARAVDYRVYLPRLMQDFVERGGRLEIVALDAANIGSVAEHSDLVVVATSGRGFSSLFARDAANSPYDRPQRAWLAGLFTGFQKAPGGEAMVSVNPGHGDAVQFPMLGSDGPVTALLISAPSADALATLCFLGRMPDRACFRATMLHKLEQWHPAIYEKIDTARFDLQGPDDLAQVAITPVVRHPIAHLGRGKYAIALGDAHVTVDPLLGQGANIGSYSAFVLADAIQEAGRFDLAFCQEVERCRSARVLGAARWINAFLQPPSKSGVELLIAMSQDQRLADEYFFNFNRPERQWQRVCSSESIRGWLGERRMRQPEPLAVIVG